MNVCPACSQAVSSSDLVCPKCGNSLHPGTATAGPASGGGGKGLSIVAIVVIALIGIVVLVGCLGVLGAGLLFGIRSAPMPAAPAPISMPATKAATEWHATESVPQQPDPSNSLTEPVPDEEPVPEETTGTP